MAGRSSHPRAAQAPGEPGLARPVQLKRFVFSGAASARQGTRRLGSPNHLLLLPRRRSRSFSRSSPRFPVYCIKAPGFRGSWPRLFRGGRRGGPGSPLRPRRRRALSAGTPLLGGAGRHGGGRRPLVGPGAPRPPCGSPPGRSRAAAPERDRVRPGLRELRPPSGRRWAGEAGWRFTALALPPREPPLSLFGPPSRSGEGSVGTAGLRRAVLFGPRGLEALGPRREQPARPARTGLTGAPNWSRAGPPRRLPRPRGLEFLRGGSQLLWMLGTSALGICPPASAGARPPGRS
ncbi:unnamed protein product [Rangifer tarandus platyrhynchus]|uniref:Uncharacterized protein n=2 Tax=Rangifer tarandus platyrhynchus TaxID=3082113 RepID=A0ACB0FBZ1_RANTA|nr:unnamed protein product [Rangifer tarandus platyrhynchus]CAI9710464.1 unnamed protein product [Rangifer tarandus platyrhynchus]